MRNCGTVAAVRQPFGTVEYGIHLTLCHGGNPPGALGDRGARVRLLALGVAVWSVLTSLSGFCQNFQQLFVVRLGIGVGEATCAPVATSLLGDLFPPQQRARAMSVFMMGLPCGMALSFLVSGWVVGNYGWRPAFWIAGLPAWSVPCRFVGCRARAWEGGW